MGETEKSISNATSLLSERRKYEGWIAALDERRATTPERVYARVRADYEARLEAVVAQLASNADTLEARIGELSQRAGTLRAEMQAVQDERAEVELRAAVGELDPEALDQAVRGADEKLGALGAELREVDEELASIRELLSAARTPTPSRAAVAVEPAAIEPRPTPAVEPAAAATEPATATGSAEPPEELHDPATGSPAASEGAAGGDAPIGEPAVAPRPREGKEGFDELAFLRDITGAGAEDPSAEPPAPPANPEPADARPSERPVDDTLGLVLPNDAPAILPTRRASTETPMAANVASNAPIVLKPEAARQEKTLKCTECRAMNYPTEWYCERCGAELSAL